MNSPTIKSATKWVAFSIFLLCMVSCGSKKTSVFTPLESEDMTNIPKLLLLAETETLQRRFVNVNMDVLRKERDLTKDSVVTFNLFDTLSLTITISKIEYGEDSTHVWTGYVNGPDLSAVSVITTPKTIFATIQVHNMIYEIYPAGSRVARVSMIDQLRYPGACEPVRRTDVIRSSNITESVDVSDNLTVNGKTEIKVMIVLPQPYYSVVCSGFAGISKTFRAACEANLKTVFNNPTNTNVTASVVIECMGYYPKGGDLEDDLGWLVSDTTIKALRHKHKADLVTLIVPEATVCGVGFLNYPIVPGDSVLGFNVVKSSCSLNNFSLAHEIGHNMGMDHNRAEVKGSYDSPECNYGYPFAILGKHKQGRTIMCYPEICDNCPKYGYYSSPLMITSQGLAFAGPLGEACDTPPSNKKYHRANNRQQLINAAPIVSKFQ